MRLVPLRGTPAEVAAVQRVLEGAPGYTSRIGGGPAGPSDGEELFADRPPGVDADHAFVWGIQVDGVIVGCADVVRGWPDGTTAIIGLLILDETHQGQGLGGAALAAVENEVRGWPEITLLRAAVVRTNDVVLPFWTGHGFEPTGQVVSYANRDVASEAVILTKSVR